MTSRALVFTTSMLFAFGGGACQRLLGIHAAPATTADAGGGAAGGGKGGVGGSIGMAGGGGDAGGPGVAGGAAAGESAGRGGASGDASAAGTVGGIGGTIATADAGGSPDGAAGETGAGAIDAGGPSDADAAPPVVISIDFVGGRASGDGGMIVVPAPMMAATEVAGAHAAPHWNPAAGATGTLAGLADASGGATPAALTWNSPADSSTTGVWTNGFDDAPGDARMMNGFLNPPTDSAPAVITVSGLPATITSRGYDVYVYVCGNIIGASARSYRYTIGTTTRVAFQLGPTPDVFPGYTEAADGGYGNYTVFRGLRDPSFTLTATPGTGNTTRAPVNGIQIVAAREGATSARPLNGD